MATTNLVIPPSSSTPLSQQKRAAHTLAGCSPPLSLGAIIGIAVGGITGLALLVFFWWPCPPSSSKGTVFVEEIASSDMHSMITIFERPVLTERCAAPLSGPSQANGLAAAYYPLR